MCSYILFEEGKYNLLLKLDPSKSTLISMVSKQQGPSLGDCDVTRDQSGGLSPTSPAETEGNSEALRLSLKTCLQDRAMEGRRDSCSSENQGLTPSTNTVVDNHLYLQFQRIQHLLLASKGTRQTCGTQRYTQAKHPYTQKYQRRSAIHVTERRDHVCESPRQCRRLVTLKATVSHLNIDEKGHKWV